MKNDDNEFSVGIVGLGYVGLTLATMLADVGVKVLGIEKRKDVVDELNNCHPHFIENGLDVLLTKAIKSGNLQCVSEFDSAMTCGIYIITVGTPLDPTGVARLDMIENATQEVADNMREDSLIIVRSTVKIGTTRSVVSPILEASGKNFSIAMCPERTLEGNALRELRSIPQILGADNNNTLDRAEALFRNLTQTTIRVSSLEAAEVVKLVDNTFRDVQFAFANEVARACEAFGVNSHEVISAGKLGYNRTNVALPGLVGGPCLEKDPHIFQQSVNTKTGINLEITQAARRVNERQPLETMRFIIGQMKKRGLDLKSKVVFLGIAFKGSPETDDLRGAMSLVVISRFRELAPSCDLHIYDPVVSDDDLNNAIPNSTIHNNLDNAIRGASVVIITNNHSEFRDKPIDTFVYNLSADGFIYDYWNNFSAMGRQSLGNHYYAVGNIGSNNES